MATTIAGTNPVVDVRQCDKKLSKYVLVPRPHVVAEYNRSMGGVDLKYRMISYYRISMRRKKWPVHFFWHIIDLALINSWIKYRQIAHLLVQLRKILLIY